jgi:hypothetical protein
MRRSGAIGLVQLALCLAVIAAPATAAGQEVLPFQLPADAPSQLRTLLRGQASAGATRARGSFHSALQLKVGDGLQLRIIGLGATVAIVADRHRATTAYLARGIVTPGRLRASFGKLGEVDVRFQPSADPSWVKAHRHCKGAGRFAVRRGVFVGTIRFRGENGFVSVDSRRAKGSVSSVAQKCRRGPVQPPPKPQASSSTPPFPELEFNSLGASWREGVSSASVGALAIGRRVFFIAQTGQSEGGIAKLRFAYGTASPRTFTYDETLTKARLAPPAPFVGVGTYRAAPDGTTSWTGSLAVNFPDASRLPLTGPQFKPVLSVGFGGR